MFNSGEKLLKICEENNLKIWEVALKNELKRSNKSDLKIIEELYDVLDVMRESSKAGLNKEIPSIGGFLKDEALKVENYRKNNITFSDDSILSSVAKAFSISQVNASMGRIVAAPTAGAAGILPAVLFTVQEKLSLKDEDLIKGLLTSAAIGEIIATNATISGAEGGCQAECGSAAAMAAASVVELSGGDPKSALDAASFALTNIMGLVCDPIGGLVEYPCALRNAAGVNNAFLSADLALAGITSIIPFDEVVDSMYKVGNKLDFTLKETALGGLAATETAKKLIRD